MSKVSKQVGLDLSQVDGNAFALLAAFRRQAHREGWSAAEIKVVLDEARTSDYGHLIAMLVAHCR